MPQQRKNQGKSQQLLLQWSEKNWCYHSLCYKSELRLCFSHWTPESEKRSGLPTILRLQVWSPPPLLVDINRNKAHIGPTHSVHVCVCLCFRERERERKRDQWWRGRWSSHHVWYQSSKFGLLYLPVPYCRSTSANSKWDGSFLLLVVCYSVVWFVRFLWGYLQSC